MEHADPDLSRLETDAQFRAGLAVPIVKQFRVVMQLIRTVPHRNALYQHRSRRLEKLEGKRQGQHSMRLNKKYRLIIEFIEERSEEIARIVSVEKHYE